MLWWSVQRKTLTWWCLVVVVSRFFVLNNEAGLLEYFVNEQSRPQKPRGMLPLAGAVISPSDEDSHTFTVNAISGEQYKLRGGSDNMQKAACQHVVCALTQELEQWRSPLLSCCIFTSRPNRHHHPSCSFNIDLDAFHYPLLVVMQERTGIDAE